MLRLYTDHNFNGHVIAGLRARGVDLLTAVQDGMRRAKDPGTLRRATQLQRVLVTHDEDFLSISAQWQARREEFSGLVYTHPMRVTIG